MLDTASLVSLDKHLFLLGLVGLHRSSCQLQKRKQKHRFTKYESLVSCDYLVQVICFGLFFNKALINIRI
jgi:hypothetical protein